MNFTFIIVYFIINCGRKKTNIVKSIDKKIINWYNNIEKKNEVIFLITENNNLEFKRELTQSIIKEIIAFANTTGGTIILGYDDNGKIVGLKNAIIEKF